MQYLICQSITAANNDGCPIEMLNKFEYILKGLTSETATNIIVHLMVGLGGGTWWDLVVGLGGTLL